VRLVHVSIPRGRRDAVLGLLEDEGIDYVVTEETSGRAFTHVVSFAIPTPAVEPVLDGLKDAGVDDDAFTVITSAETVVSERFDELKERYEEDETPNDRIARDELRARAEELAAPLPTYLSLTFVSAVIATAGLLLDSPATVVGSMVIAPLIGPAMSASVGTVIDDREMFSRGVRLQVVGMTVAIAAAAAFAFLVQTTNLIPPGIEPSNIDQIQVRLQPDFLALAIALGAGAAGAISLTAGVSAAIVGVMIAVALVPPAATVGIGLAFGLPGIAIPSAVLTVVNGLSVNLAALIVFWYRGYRPEHFFRRDEARSATLTRVAVLSVLIIILSAFLGGVTYDSYQSARTEDDIRENVRPLFDAGGEYERLSLTSLCVQTEPSPELPILRQVDRVIVTIGVPPGGETQGVARALDDRVESAIGESVVVEVRYVDVETVGGTASGRSSNEPLGACQPLS
jgi:uncharacterized hydrophobic protein (TIGR00341 family)